MKYKPPPLPAELLMNLQFEIIGPSLPELFNPPPSLTAELPLTFK
jgi:hypothetical protein